ncbi:hypothetical protein QR680_014610 [Steinernema hermaphroditum]|uniref:Uncharacterized protein n=1 Tax=Steinernema hermaphroditum TaxID=289476 RepID=A0AA39I9I2_9BILA|nr:hypothetical protein QR680_014610 [Steinernema hermaphroditum]
MVGWSVSSNDLILRTPSILMLPFLHLDLEFYSQSDFGEAFGESGEVEDSLTSDQARPQSGVQSVSYRIRRDQRVDGVQKCQNAQEVDLKTSVHGSAPSMKAHRFL